MGRDSIFLKPFGLLLGNFILGRLEQMDLIGLWVYWILLLFGALLGSHLG